MNENNLELDDKDSNELKINWDCIVLPYVTMVEDYASILLLDDEDLSMLLCCSLMIIYVLIVVPVHHHDN